MTLQKCVDLIKQFAHTGDITVTSNDGNLTTFIIDCINLARKDVQFLIPKEWSRTAGTISVTNALGSSYTTSTTVNELIGFRFLLNGENDFRVLTKVTDLMDFYRYFNPVSTATAIPEKWAQTGYDLATGAIQFQISPYPDRSFTLACDYFKKWTTEVLTSANLASEIPEIPEQFHGVLLKGGLFYFLKAYDDPAQVAAQQDYEAAKRQLDKAEDADLDTEVSFRLGVQQVRTY